LVASLFVTSVTVAQQQPAPTNNWSAAGSTNSYSSPSVDGYAAAPYGYGSPLLLPRSSTEIGALYVTAGVYGAGLGIWFGAEADIDDPALFLIAPALLGVAAPAVVYAADQDPLRRGVPAAIAAGAFIGAGEGIAIANLQFVRAKKEDAWGFRGLSRATALGATLGAAGGIAIGVLQQPSPRSSVLVSSSVVWGSAIGAMYGYGGSAAGIGYGRANDSAALGGLVGYNVALAGAAALSLVYIPTSTTLKWMWAGAGIGFVASLPVYLLYLGADSAPAKRGLIFSATATTLGLAAGALFTLGSTEESARSHAPAWARITSLGPLGVPGVTGLSLAGELH
jgi:hypothetical protein